MSAITPLTYDDKIGTDEVVPVYSDAPDNISAIREIDEWARQHGYVRSRETTLNVRQGSDGQRLFYSACYLFDDEDRHAAFVDIARIRERRERMPVTVSSDLLLREDE